MSGRVVAVVHPPGGPASPAVARQSRRPPLAPGTWPTWRDAVLAALGGGGEWLWLVAGDVAPAPDALERLLEIADTDGALPAAPVLLSSRILRPDGTLDPACAPWVPFLDRTVAMAAADRGLASVRMARWGSLLVRTEAIRRIAAPRPGYSAAGDLEWTLRLLAERSGFVVPGSVAIRQAGPRHGRRAELRDRARMLAAGGWGPNERAWFAYMTAVGIGRIPSRRPRATVVSAARLKRLIRR